MKLADFDYELPDNLIATEPMRPRDHSRLLIMKRRLDNEVKIEHKKFYDVVDYLNKGDVLVLNNSRVMPARLLGKKFKSGGKMEIFLLKASPLPTGRQANSSLLLMEGEKCVWECLVGGGGAKEGLEIEFDKNLKGKILKNNNDGTWVIEFSEVGKKFHKIINEIGQMPLPPYIVANRKSGVVNRKTDKKDYQTVFSDDDKIGSVAAPTAGLHFTPELLQKIKDKGVKIEYITLHVGLGTFAPVKVDDVTKHKMHSEFVEIFAQTIEEIKKAKKQGNKIITVGTTSTRTLESYFSNSKTYHSNSLKPNIYTGWVDIFIYPGYEFKIVDAMITNFHQPKSTLIMLVSALAGRENIMDAYQEAIEKQYRFFSYGDAMMIL